MLEVSHTVLLGLLEIEAADPTPPGESWVLTGVVDSLDSYQRGVLTQHHSQVSGSVKSLNFTSLNKRIHNYGPHVFI